MSIPKEKIDLAENNIVFNLEIVDNAVRRKALKVIRYLKKETAREEKTDYYIFLVEKLVSNWSKCNAIITPRYYHEQIKNENYKRSILLLDQLNYKEIKIASSINMKLFIGLNKKTIKSK